MALGILEGFDVSALPVDSADSLHLQLEAMKLAFADLYEYVADCATMRISNAQLLDKEYLRSRAVAAAPPNSRRNYSRSSPRRIR
jgi:gamma-glutamyltranspeptidase / glutathione hydrolase